METKLFTRNFLRDFSPVIVAGLISLVLLASGIAFFWSKQQAERRLSIERSREANKLVANRIENIVSGAIQIINTLRQEMPSDASGPSDDLVAYSKSPEFHEKMRLATASYSSIIRTSFIDNEGLLAAVSTRHPAPYVSLADSNFFKICKDAAPYTLAVTPPLKTRFDGSDVFVICSPVVDKSGSKRGTLMAAINRSSIDDIFAVSLLSAAQNHVLAMRNGAIIATANPRAGGQGPGGNIANALFLTRYNEARQGFLTSAKGTNPALTTERVITASEPIAGLPLILGGALTADVIHRASNEEVKILVPALIFAIALIMFIGFMVGKFNRNKRLALGERQEALAIESQARENADNFRKEKSDFFSLVSHDLRTPLMSIVTATELIKLRGVEPKNLELMDIVLASCSQMKSLLNSVLTVNSADSSKIVSDIEPFSIPLMLTDLIKTCKMAIPSADIHLQAMDGSIFPHMVMGKKTILNQIVLNLVSNAAKYAGKKPITVTLAYLQVLSNKTKFRISVIDQGPGMEPDLVDRMFAPYERGETSRAQRPDGMGLGLWIADRLIRELDGTIDVESVPGQGSAFHITLSMDKYIPGQTTNVSETALLPANQNELRILLADDSASIRIIVAAYLRTLGHTPVEAANGVEAIAALTSETFDLAILDLEMPDAGGIELARRIRSDNVLGHMPVILMTGTEKDKLPDLEGLDITTVLQKPVTLGQLKEAINSVRVSRENGYAETEEAVRLRS